MSQKAPAGDDTIEIPENMQLSVNEDGMVFSYRWYKVKYLLAIVLAPIFAYILVHSEYIPGDFSEPGFPAFIVMGVCMAICYYSLARILNKTRIQVSPSRIRVLHGPIPFSKNRVFEKNDVSQLYVTKHSVGHRYRIVITTFQINIILANKRVVTLVRGLSTAAQGLFIEQKIESFFNIVDVPVSGEVDKSDY